MLAHTKDDVPTKNRVRSEAAPSAGFIFSSLFSHQPQTCSTVALLKLLELHYVCATTKQSSQP